MSMESGLLPPGDPMAEALARLLYGLDAAEVARLQESGEVNAGSIAATWRRLLERVGVTRHLAPGQNLVAGDGQLEGVVRLADGRDWDVLELVPWLLRHDFADDRAYETVTDRGSLVRTAQHLQPGDAAVIRYRSVSPEAMSGRPLRGGSEDEAVARVHQVLALMAAYTAWPHFIPAPAAFDAATGLPPDPGTELRLPAESVLVFHDGIPLPAVTADDATLHAHVTAMASAGAEKAALFGRSLLIVGGLLLGCPDDTGDTYVLDPDQGWLIVSVHADHGPNQFGLVPVTHLERSSPAARILRNYSALLGLEGWDVPPPVPGRARSCGKNRGKKSRGLPPAERRRRARTPQALAGALLRVRSFTAPPHQPAPPAQAPPAPASGPGKPAAQYREWRRAHFTRNTRVHLLDEHGRPSGPVYGPEAIEGVTFTRRRTWVRGTWVNEHLPPRPGLPVYALDPRIARSPTET
ncbi:hypothetical protein ACIG3E_33740 [Streptomyces sp. NPDC053474]|uniref:hypothetical protein n=1 Tax=Streptomyces sp. NPDC053474 TaxID=3365704 RepID=UPI0037D32BBF